MAQYFPLLVLFAVGLTLSGVFVLLSRFIGKKKYHPEKMIPYECGLDPVCSSRQRFSVKFYLVAILFILFDVEVVFLYPWATLFGYFKGLGLGAFLFVEMILFLGILTLGLVYVWRRGALEWD